MRTAWVVEATGDERAWLRGRLGTAADGVVAKGVAGNGRAWLRGPLRTAWVQWSAWTGDERAWLRGRLRMAWVQEDVWKWVGKRRPWG